MIHLRPMLLWRMRGTPRTWRPSAKTVRHARYEGTPSGLVVGAMALVLEHGERVTVAPFQVTPIA